MDPHLGAVVKAKETIPWAPHSNPNGALVSSTLPGDFLSFVYTNAYIQ